MDTGKSKTENEPRTTRDDYLWDRSGEPDPEIERLQALLGVFRHDLPTPVFPEIVPESRWTFLHRRPRLFPLLMATAAGVAAVVLGMFVLHERTVAPVIAAGWDVSRLAGTPRIGRKTIAGTDGTAHLG